MNIKQNYPRININLLGNLHQAKTIHFIERMKQIRERTVVHKMKGKK
jgi:hypothetical protein